MILDKQYESSFSLSEREHLYGENVHILCNPLAETFLTRLSHPDTKQPELNKLIEYLYNYLFDAVANTVFPKEVVQSDTRMKEHTEKGLFYGEVLKRDTFAVAVDIARAGIYPAHICFEQLSRLLNPDLQRQDHFYMQRVTDDSGKVCGVDVSGSKIGGGVEDAYVLLPDPMGATGGSLSYTISHYKNNVEGQAKKYICMHLIVTPEFISRIKKDHPDALIFALRLDRGMSSDKALSSLPGAFPEEESGLNEFQYIVPGAGGVGEILNNSFV